MAFGFKAQESVSRFSRNLYGESRLKELGNFLKERNPDAVSGVEPGRTDLGVHPLKI